MPTIVLSQTDLVLATDASGFTLRANKRLLARLPANLMDNVIVFHGVEVTRNALGRLGDLGVPVAFLDRDGRVQARLVAPWKHTSVARIEQSRVWLDPQARLVMAKRWVQAKLGNSAVQLRRHASNYHAPEVSYAASAIEDLIPRLETIDTHDSLLGVEGTAGRIYFEAFRHVLRCDWTTFKGRNRRPPLDPVNAALSFVYTILCNRLHAYVEAAGLDPCIGYLHSVETRRPNLALDLMEPFRSLLGDRLVLRLFNLRQLRAEHFQAPEPSGAVYLNIEGRKAVLATLEPWSAECDEELDAPPGASRLTSPDRLLQLEVERYQAAAKKEALAAFEPYGFLQNVR